MPSEAEIVWQLKVHLQQLGLGPNQAVSNIAVDRDGSYLRSGHARSLEPMMSMPIQGFHPDLVCSYQDADAEGIAAFEVKACFDDWLKGLTQARAYRTGVHRAYIALPADKSPRLSALECDASESGVGVWLLRDGKWEQTVAPARPRPSVGECAKLVSALRGVVFPRRLQLNYPLNYLAAAWVRYRRPNEPLAKAFAEDWITLKTPGSRAHAINGARYLGLIKQDESLTSFGLLVCDLLAPFDFASAVNIDHKKRLSDVAPKLAAISRLVSMQQEGTKLVMAALTEAGNQPMNTAELLKAAAAINEPLASGLFLSDPSKIENPSSADFNPSFVFQFKQSLWHAGLLATSAHSSSGKGATLFSHHLDMWQMEDRLFRVQPK